MKSCTQTTSLQISMTSALVKICLGGCPVPSVTKSYTVKTWATIT